MHKLIDFFDQKNIEYKASVSLKEISSFRIGGCASLVCFPNSSIQVCEIVKFCNKNCFDYLTFGKCSNVVFSDKGIDKLIIKTDKIDGMSQKGNIFSFGSGVMLAKASKFSIDHGHKGMEFAYGIPGSVGGAVYMNAGAYGGQMSDLVVQTEYVDENSELHILKQGDHDFDYRHSFFSDKNFIITKTDLALSVGDKEESEALVKEFQNARKTKQPLELPSAGSVFKRPEGYFAGKLIQDCGLKGVSIGGASVSEKHSGFIVNTGNATCDDVKQLVSHIQQSVYDKFGVRLECELKFIE